MKHRPQRTLCPSTDIRLPLADSATVGPYVLVDESLSRVANDWTDLTICEAGVCLEHAIDCDESGALRVAQVWTGTQSEGASWSNLDCVQWTDTYSEVFGGDGGSGAVNTFWTPAEAIHCGNANSLYCFQQG